MVSGCARVKGGRGHRREEWNSGLEGNLEIFIGIKISGDVRELTPVICSNKLRIAKGEGRTTKGIGSVQH